MNCLQKSTKSSFLGLVAVFATIGLIEVSGQAEEHKDDILRQIRGNSARVLRLPSAPEATEECTPEECAWWERVRESILVLRGAVSEPNARKRDPGIRTAMEAYFLLLQEGRDRGYRVPLGDRPPQMLLGAPPQRTHIARKQNIKGEIKIAITISEFGIVTEAVPENRLGWGLDERALASARMNYFLPAVRNREFVTHESKVTIGFH